jgi:hypothetical protein
MSQLLQRILDLVVRQKVLISDHGYDELAADDIVVQDIIIGISEATVIEEYPTYHKGPCVLVLQRDHDGKSIHVLWGLAKNTSSPAVIVTAYRPDATRWTDDFLRRNS